MKKETDYRFVAISMICFFLACILFLTSISLTNWNKENLNPCCNNMCGQTVSFEECQPQRLAGTILVIGILLIGLGVANLYIHIKNLLDPE